MDERPDRLAATVSAAVFAFMLCAATVASWVAPEPPDAPLAEAPEFTVVAHFEGAASCLPGWRLVDAEPVWRVPYIPGRPWASVDATEAELRAAYTRPDGTVAQDRLTAAQGRYVELVRVTCRYAPLAPRGSRRAD